MESNSNRKSGSSARSTSRKRVVIGAQGTSKVRYKKKEPTKAAPLRRHPAKGPSEQGPGSTGHAGQRVAKTKRDERQRRQRDIERRRIALGLAAAIAVVALVAGIVALARAPILPVRSIVVTGAHRLTMAEVITRAHVPADATLLRLPVAEIQRSLTADPWIGEVEVVRHFPGTVELRITERTPAAVADAGGAKLWLVDGAGVWLAKASADQSSTLPTIRDIENLAPRAGVRSPSPELINALQVWAGISPELRAKVHTISAPTVDRTVLLLPHGVQVFVGSSADIAKKDTVARAILSDHKNVVYVNVRVVNRATWRALDTAN